LRKNSGLIVDGPILEAENETRDYPIPPDGLGKITRRKNFAFQRPYREKAVDRSLTIADEYRFGGQWAGLEQNDCKQVHQ